MSIDSRDDTPWLMRLRWKLTVKLMRWAVDTAPRGDARDLLHAKHLEWIAECKRQWAMRHGHRDMTTPAITDAPCWPDENPWPRAHYKNKPKVAAKALSRAARVFLLDHLAGKRPAVPDCVWHGEECWIIEWPSGLGGWRINAFAREVAKELGECA